MNTEQQTEPMVHKMAEVLEHWKRQAQSADQSRDAAGYRPNDVKYYKLLAQMDSREYCALADEVKLMFQDDIWRHPKYDAWGCQSVCDELKQVMQSPSDDKHWDTERHIPRGCEAKRVLFKFYKMILEVPEEDTQ